jgi:hypothetical protein
MRIKVEREINHGYNGAKLKGVFDINITVVSGPEPTLDSVDKTEILRLLWEIRNIIISRFLSKGIV